jgi:hypothetical protein
MYFTLGLPHDARQVGKNLISEAKDQLDEAGQKLLNQVPWPTRCPYMGQLVSYTYSLPSVCMDQGSDILLSLVRKHACHDPPGCAQAKQLLDYVRTKGPELLQQVLPSHQVLILALV